MITQTELVTSMTEAYVRGASLQGTVRKFIRQNEAKLPNETAEEIATVVTEYRRTIDQMISDDGLTGPDLKAAVKKRDNIINDVSRICRELLGQSIVCTSRKKGEYSAKFWTPTVREPKPVPEAETKCALPHLHHGVHVEYPKTDKDLLEILSFSKDRYGYSGVDRVTLLADGSEHTAEDVCAIATMWGVSLEDLAKHLLAVLKGK